MAKIKDGTIERVSSVRARTWTLTLAILVALILYFLVSVVWKDSINFIDLLVSATIQIIMHVTYFPDGEIFGTRDKKFTSNKDAYNKLASEINEKRQVGKLREYCDYEYEQRKERYIKTKCGAIGITLEELELFKSVPPKNLKSKEYDSFKVGEDKVIYLTKRKRKVIYDLLYNEIPIERNSADTILSCIETNFTKAIKDTSGAFKNQTHIKKIFSALVVGTFLAYIGFSARQGEIFFLVVKVVMHLVSAFTTAVLSFSKGETCTKINKNNYYIELCLFLENFKEWNKGE